MPSLRHPASSITCPSSSPISHLTSFSRRRCHNGWSFAVRSTLDPKSSEDRGACQLRRRSGYSCGTSTKQRRTPSGSATHISTSPHGSRLGSRRIRTPRAELPSHRSQLAHLQPQRHARDWRCSSTARQLQEPATQEEDRAPVRPTAELAVDRQAQPVAVEHPATLRVGWVQQHPAAQHVHGPMITQQTHPGHSACSKPKVPQPTAAEKPRSPSLIEFSELK